MFDSAANEVIKIASFVCAMAYHRPDTRHAIQRRWIKQRQNEKKNKPNQIHTTATTKTHILSLAGNCMRCLHQIFMPIFYSNRGHAVDI